MWVWVSISSRQPSYLVSELVTRMRHEIAYKSGNSHSALTTTALSSLPINVHNVQVHSRSLRSASTLKCPDLSDTSSPGKTVVVTGGELCASLSLHGGAEDSLSTRQSWNRLRIQPSCCQSRRLRGYHLQARPSPFRKHDLKIHLVHGFTGAPKTRTR